MMGDIILITHMAKGSDEILAKSFCFAEMIPPQFAQLSHLIHERFSFAHLETETTHIYFERIVVPRRIVREAILN